jgi:hypothetical protein
VRHGEPKIDNPALFDHLVGACQGLDAERLGCFEIDDPSSRPGDGCSYDGIRQTKWQNAGAALDAVADLIFEKMIVIIEERERLWSLAREATES